MVRDFKLANHTHLRTESVTFKGKDVEIETLRGRKKRKRRSVTKMRTLKCDWRWRDQKWRRGWKRKDREVRIWGWWRKGVFGSEEWMYLRSTNQSIKHSFLPYWRWIHPKVHPAKLSCFFIFCLLLRYFTYFILLKYRLQKILMLKFIHFWRKVYVQYLFYNLFVI